MIDKFRMSDVLHWLQENRQWVFSGIGVAIASAVIVFIVRAIRRPKSPTVDLARADLQQRQHASRPVFAWAHSDTSDFITLTCQFRNEGGSVSQLSVESTGALAAAISPRDALPSPHVGFVRLSSRAGRLPFPIQFEIHYTTSLNHRERQVFRLQSFEMQPEEVV